MEFSDRRVDLQGCARPRKRPEGSARTGAPQNVNSGYQRLLLSSPAAPNFAFASTLTRGGGRGLVLRLDPIRPKTDNRRSLIGVIRSRPIQRPRIALEFTFSSNVGRRAQSNALSCAKGLSITLRQSVGAARLIQSLSSAPGLINSNRTEAISRPQMTPMYFFCISYTLCLASRPRDTTIDVNFVVQEPEGSQTLRKHPDTQVARDRSDSR